MAEEADDASGPGQAAPAAAHAKSGRSRPSVGGSSPKRVPAFAAVVVASGVASAPSQTAGPPTSGRIEIAIGDAVVRIVTQVETALLTAVQLSMLIEGIDRRRRVWTARPQTEIQP